MTQSDRISPLAALSIAVPVVIAIVGLRNAFYSELAPGDWLGIGIWVRAAGALTLAALSSVIIAGASFCRREPKAAVSLICAIPASLFLFGCLMLLGSAYLNRKGKEAERVLIGRIIAEPEFRDSYVMSRKRTARDLRIFLDRAAADALSSQQVRHLWIEWKSVWGGGYFSALILSKNTPPEVLEEYYEIVMHSAEKSRGVIHPRTLIDHAVLLLHPNLPRDLIDVIRELDDPDVNAILERRTPSQPNQALQTTPMTRSVYEKTTEFGYPQRVV